MTSTPDADEFVSSLNPLGAPAERSTNGSGSLREVVEPACEITSPTERLRRQRDVAALLLEELGQDPGQLDDFLRLASIGASPRRRHVTWIGTVRAPDKSLRTVKVYASGIGDMRERTRAIAAGRRPPVGPLDALAEHSTAYEALRSHPVCADEVKAWPLAVCDEWDATGARRHKLYTMHDGGGRALVERIERWYEGSTTALLAEVVVPHRAWMGWLQFGVVVDETGREAAPASVAFTGDDLGDDVIARLADRFHGSTDPWLELIAGVEHQWGSAKTTAVGIGLGPSPKLNIYVAPTAGAVAPADSPQRPAPLLRATEVGVADLAPIDGSFAGLAGMHELAADLAERRLPG